MRLPFAAGRVDAADGVPERATAAGRAPELARELPEQVLPDIPKKARAEVRRARDKFRLEFEDSDDLELFFRMFTRNKRRLGTPSLPLRWFQALRDEVRCTLARDYLRDTQLSTEDIAAALGFGDAANFRHAFKRWTGESPGAVRRRGA